MYFINIFEMKLMIYEMPISMELDKKYLKFQLWAIDAAR